MTHWFLRLVLALSLTVLSMPARASDGPVSVFVIDFPTAAQVGTEREYIDLMKRSSLGDARYVIIDPRGVSILFDGLDPGQGKVARGSELENDLKRLSSRAQATEDRPYDLARTSELLTQLVLANPGVGAWQFFFLAGIRHTDDEFTFEGGYPNDGFLFLKDSEFGYVSRLQEAHGIEVHVFHSDRFEYRDEYDRFMQLWSDEVWKAKLVSFNDGIDIGNRPSYDMTPINLDVDRSAIVQPGDRPSCETFDQTSVRELAYGTIEFTITNPCRANSVVVLRRGEREFSGEADDTGKVVIPVVLEEGENIVSIRTPEGGAFNEIHRHQVGPARDAVEVLVNNDGTVTLKGYHPLRPDGSLVTIRNERMDRTWTVPVLTREWELRNVPLGPGLNQFDVVQTDGESTVPVPVRNDAECSHSRQVEESRGLAVIHFQDSCMAGQNLTLNYLGQGYLVSFDSDGKAIFKIGLSQTVNRITYDLRGTERMIEIPVSSLAALLRVTLEWDARVDLDLHVTEPDGGHVYHAQLAGKYGEIDRDDIGTQAGRHQETYVIERSALNTGDEIAFVVTDYSRRNLNVTNDHCDGGAFATVPFTVVVLDRGEATRIEKSFEPFPCVADRNALIEASTIEVYRYVED